MNARLPVPGPCQTPPTQNHQSGRTSGIHKCPVCRTELSQENVQPSLERYKEIRLLLCPRCDYLNVNPIKAVFFVLLLCFFVSGSYAETIVIDTGEELEQTTGVFRDIISIAKHIVGWFVIIGFLLNLVRAKYTHAYNRRLLFLSLLGCFLSLLFMTAGDTFITMLIELRMKLGGG